MADAFDDKRISEALELLNQVAKEKLAELQEMVSDKYSDLKSAFGGAAEGLHHHHARGACEHGNERVKDFASNVDDSAHRNPWPYIGGAAIGCLILGYSFGKSRR